MDEARRDALARFLTGRLGGPAVVERVERITVGHSRAMYRVDLAGGATFVVRMEQGGVFGTSSVQEFEVMAALGTAGFPVAPVRWLEPSGAVLGQPFFVMDFVESDQAADERAIDATTATEFVTTLARLHALDWRAAGVPLGEPPDPPERATHDQVERWAGVYRRAAPTPIPLLEEAAAWLHHFAPPLRRAAIVHGDAGPGNFLHRGGQVVAVTDWEFVHLGDPAEDWSFCLTMRGSRTMPRAAWLDLFEQAGVTLSARDWAYWEAFNLFKGACANVTCLDVFERGVNRAPNMAIIGTYVHQRFLRRLVDCVATNLEDPR